MLQYRLQQNAGAIFNMAKSSLKYFCDKEYQSAIHKAQSNNLDYRW